MRKPDTSAWADALLLLAALALVLLSSYRGVTADDIEPPITTTQECTR